MRASIISLMQLALLVAAAPAPAADAADPYDRFRSPAESESQEFDFDDSLIKPWKEQQTEVPVLSEADLQRIRIDHGPAGMRYSIDTATLTVSEKDGVVRYWVVMESGGRFTNVLYEGLKCGDLTYKTYAYASPRRTSLIKYMKTPRWERIGGLSGNDFRRDLAEYYLCSLGSARSREGILAAFKQSAKGFSPNAEDADFLPK